MEAPEWPANREFIRFVKIGKRGAESGDPVIGRSRVIGPHARCGSGCFVDEVDVMDLVDGKHHGEDPGH